MTDRFSYHLPDISCGHCVKRISGILDSFGVQGFEISLEEKRIFADAPLAKEVLEVLEEAGYPVSS